MAGIEYGIVASGGHITSVTRRVKVAPAALARLPRAEYFRIGYSCSCCPARREPGDNYTRVDCDAVLCPTCRAIYNRLPAVARVSDPMAALRALVALNS